jgi:hypothetical protein
MQEKPPLPSWMEPLWVRALCVVVPAAWAIFEFWNAEAVWGVIFCSVSAWGLYSLIIAYKPPGSGA